jgi:hypothetical protein
LQALDKIQSAIADAKALVAKSFADPGSVETTLANAALNIAPRYGDAALFDQLAKMSQDAANAQDRANALRALTLFRDPALVKARARLRRLRQGQESGCCVFRRFRVICARYSGRRLAVCAG